MPDAKITREPEDRSRITLVEQWEVRYWIESFGVSDAELRKAVSIVGNGAEPVRRFLKKGLFQSQQVLNATM
jgi:uncharacterized protein DUF3606